jgi:hypothetical protein
VNVPVLSIVVVEQQLCSLWAQHGEVIALTPHTYKGTSLLTNHWDMVLKLPQAGTPLSATPIFDLLGFKVMASWPGSDKACPRCKVVGHDSQSCPQCKAAKKPQKSTTSNKQPSPISTNTSTAVPSSSTVDATADTADKDTPASDPKDDGYTPALTRSQRKRKNKQLRTVATSSTSSAPASIADESEDDSAMDISITTSSSSSEHTLPSPAATCPFSFSPEQMTRHVTKTNSDWIDYANRLKHTQSRKSLAITTFMELPAETIAATLKAQYMSQAQIK